MNRNIACLNLSDGLRSLILFGAAHVAVLYDYKNNSQKLLQGHVSIFGFASFSSESELVFILRIVFLRIKVFLPFRFCIRFGFYHISY